MKNLFAAALAVVALAACNNDNKGDDPQPSATEVYIDASSKTAWHYYSFAVGEVVGSADESTEGNAAWAARTDWDFAIQRYNIRTNGGAFSSSKAGVFVFDADQADEFGNINVKTKFADVAKVPAGAIFSPDEAFTTEKMGGGTETVVRSKAVVVQLWRDAVGTIMPPSYRPAPVCIFRTANGKAFCKVQFTQYKNESNVAGHVKFTVAKI